MEKIRDILGTVPFLAHLTCEELEIFFKSGRVSSLKPGQNVELKKSSSLNIVLRGMFEVETVGYRDVVYLAPGSFFGTLPFTDNKIRGNIRALTESEVFIINEDEFYRFFLTSYKTLRGYLRMIANMGFEINPAGKKYADAGCRVISVYSKTSGAGKSYLASLLSMALSGEMVILLDVSYRGKTVFDYFNSMITVPLSVKDSDEDGAESVINDRIVRYSENLHLLNISFSSRVKTDPDILKPVLLSLSKDYKYIVADLSDDDHELRNRMFRLSDFIFAITDGRKDLSSMQDDFDDVIDEGQRIIYVRNNRMAQGKGAFRGGLILNRCESESPENPDIMEKFVADGNLKSFTDMISGESRALVLSGSPMESIFFCPLLTELDKSRKNFHYIYSSSYSFFLVALFLLFENSSELRENLKRFYSPEQVARNLDIVFPEKFIFSNSRLLKYTYELASTRRLEMFHPLPLCRLSTGDSSSLMSCGSLAKIMAASLSLSPEYEPVDINGAGYFTDLTGSGSNPAHLLRTSADDIYAVSVNNKVDLRLPAGVYNEFYASSLYTGERISRSFKDYLEPGRNLILDVSETEYKFDKIFNSASKASQLIVSKIV